MSATLLRYLLCLLGLSPFAVAQDLRIDVPAARLVAPGEFVTLVFRIDSRAELTLSGEVISALGWRILRQPTEVPVTASSAQPVAVTVEVPPDAQAFVTDTVTLRLSGGAETVAAQTTLTVSEVVDLDLQLPDTVVLGGGGATATVANRGNIDVEAELEVRRDGETIARLPFTVAPGASWTEPLPVTEEGSYEVRLLIGTRVISRTVQVLTFGVPVPPPLDLRAEASAALDSTGRWNVALTLEGALSDFVTVDARLGSDLEQAFLSLSDATEQRSLHVGADPPLPFRLPLPTAPGILLQQERDRWTTAVAAGWSPDSGAAAYAALRYVSEAVEMAAAVGGADAQPFGVARGRLDLSQQERSAASLDAAFSYRADRLDASVAVDTLRLSDRARTGIDLELHDALGRNAGFEIRASASDRIATLRAALELAIGPDATGSWHVGGDFALATALAGQLRALLQLGAPNSFALANYSADLNGDWRTQNTAGILGDGDGFGVRLSSLWIYGSGPSNNAQIGANLTYRPTQDRVDGRIDARVNTEIDALALLASAGWDLSERSLNAGLSAVWRGDDWRLQFDLGIGYLTDGSADPFRAELGLHGSYGVDLSPVPGLVAAAGGRNLGRIEGRIAAGERPIEGAVVEIGRFRLRSDADGRFVADLEPGPYRLQLDVATLPIDVRPFGATEQVVDIPLQGTIAVVFDLRETASIAGRVLVDSDGDGVADVPSAGVRARLVLIEANGVVRSLETAADGTFAARGVTPGASELRLVELPFGSSTVGPAVQSFDAAAGERLEVIFLSRPAQASAQTFGAGPRISRIDISPATFPPGAAPLLRITVRGAPERVFVVGPEATVELAAEGDLWVGRYPLSDDTPPGPVTVQVVAQAGDQRGERQARLLVDAEAPLFDITANGPVAPGATLAVQVDTYFAATSVRVDSELAGGAALQEIDTGRWSGDLAIPEGSSDGIYRLTVLIERSDGRRFEGGVDFRVLVAQGP